jgi:hypothetical protein
MFPSINCSDFLLNNRTVEPGLFEPKSLLPGNGILPAEIKALSHAMVFRRAWSSKVLSIGKYGVSPSRPDYGRHLLGINEVCF